MATQYRSRLARKESRRLMRQAVLMLVIAVVIVVAGAFWGIPAMVRLAGVLGEINSANEPVEVNQVVAPYAPRLVVPYEATSSSSIAISGFAPAETSVTLSNNGESVATTTTNQQGEFTFSQVLLSRGENQLVAIAAANNVQSPPSPVYSIVFDNTPPQITIDSPTDGSALYGITSQNITIRGQVDKPSQVYINDRFTVLSADLVFSQQFRLNNGENTIVVRAVDSAGNISQNEIKVSFSE